MFILTTVTSKRDTYSDRCEMLKCAVRVSDLVLQRPCWTSVDPQLTVHVSGQQSATVSQTVIYVVY